jgi:acetyl-CoA carboxylase biotin carboxyl carrier protein
MLTHEDVEEILRLLDATPVEEFELETAHFKLTLRRSASGAGRWTQERQTRSATDRLPATDSGPATPGQAAASAGAVVAGPAGASTGASAMAAAADVAPASAAHLEVRAPLVGSFYRAPKPGAPPFVEIGSSVNADTVVAIIETMKLMNSVYAGGAGRVIEICIGDGGFVEQHQVLMRLAADVA